MSTEVKKLHDIVIRDLEAAGISISDVKPYSFSMSLEDHMKKLGQRIISAHSITLDERNEYVLAIYIIEGVIEYTLFEDGDLYLFSRRIDDFIETVVNFLG